MSRLAVLPVLHLNGYKIANPTILARIPHEELESLLIGHGHKPYFVEGDDPLRAEFSTSQTGESVQCCRGSKSF
jgi:phosphoketolase